MAKPGLVISASRTRDMVNRSPDVLADILLGEAACRLGPYSPTSVVDPAQVHTVVLWTKDPTHLLTHSRLREALFTLQRRHGTQVALQLSATGLGGSFLEPGIPRWQDTAAKLEMLLGQGWINPAATVFRFDPFVRVKTSGGKRFGNLDSSLFREICARFASLGVRRATSSRGDAVHYPKVMARVALLRLEWEHIPDQEAVGFCLRLDEISSALGVSFSVCCEPGHALATRRWGCIDGAWLNDLGTREDTCAPEVLHNKVGKQRPACQCTYSRDIGHSRGSSTCFSGGMGCLYCYAQGNVRPPKLERLAEEVAEFEAKPEEYLRRKGLSERLWRG